MKETSKLPGRKHIKARRKTEENLREKYHELKMMCFFFEGKLLYHPLDTKKTKQQKKTQKKRMCLKTSYSLGFLSRFFTVVFGARMAGPGFCSLWPCFSTAGPLNFFTVGILPVCKLDIFRWMPWPWNVEGFLIGIENPAPKKNYQPPIRLIPPKKKQKRCTPSPYP